MQIGLVRLGDVGLGAAAFRRRGCAEEGDDAYGEVVAVHKGDVVECLLGAGLEGEFGEGGRRVAGASTCNGAAAVARRAGLTWSIVGRCGPPHSPLPVDANGLQIAAAWSQAETGGRWAGASVGLDSRLDVLLAIVYDG